MAIDAHCPFCDKVYRLKDELAGKRVTCANQGCRKVFTVSASSNGPPMPAAQVPPPTDAESLAAAALADDEAPPPEDTRTIAMKCAACDHEWTEPWAKQGKNVLCPDCRTRTKVPEQKNAGKADWKDARRPTLAKVDRLEGVVASQDNTMISGQTIRDAGLIEVEYEPRPITFYLKWGLAGLAALLLIGGGIAWSLRSRQERKHDELWDKSLQALDSAEMKSLPPSVAPLYRAALLIAGAEYEARKLDQASRDEAARHFGEARAELDRAPRSAERDALLGELAVALLVLGGTDDEVRDHLKLPWVPLPPKLSRAEIKPNQAEKEGVQGQLRRVFEGMKGLQIDPDLRAYTARRVARELIRYDQVPMLLNTLQAGFQDAEQPEIRGQIGLELFRAGKLDQARAVAEELKAQLPGGGPAGNPAPLVQALWLAIDPPIKSPELVVAPSGGEVSDASRLAYVALNLVQKKPDEALRIARLPGKTEGKLRALALAVEWADQPAPFADAAADAVTAELRRNEAERSLPPGQVLIRLARAAVWGGLPDRVETFIQSIPDEGLREWGKAEVYRETLAANPDRDGKDEDAAVPDDVKKYRLGHAWARLHLARHNARRANDRGLAQKYRNAWPTNTIAPFGQAGVALGIQDAEQGK